jgi:hypothetical protein
MAACHLGYIDALVKKAHSRENDGEMMALHQMNLASLQTNYYAVIQNSADVESPLSIYLMRMNHGDDNYFHDVNPREFLQETWSKVKVESLQVIL